MYHAVGFSFDQGANPSYVGHGEWAPKAETNKRTNKGGRTVFIQLDLLPASQATEHSLYGQVKMQGLQMVLVHYRYRYSPREREQ